MNPNCELRRPSTVATQSLWFLNDQQIVEHSERLAEQVMKRKDRDEQVTDLFERLFAVEPTDDELRECGTFVEEQTKRLGDEKRGMASLCQALLASNRFLYVD